MNALTEEETQELKKHFALRVRPQYKPSTINRIIEVVNKIRLGEMKDTEFVNPVTKILTWDVMLENFGLYPRFVRME